MLFNLRKDEQLKRREHSHAGTMGLKGDLTAGEIVEQLVHAQGVTRIKNVVFMVRCTRCSVLCVGHVSGTGLLPLKHLATECCPLQQLRRSPD